ncbi:hypothetical protein Hanom_Chr12g01143541 [Helianthus anomalus]
MQHSHSFQTRFLISFANQVIGTRVTDGVVFSVSVEVEDFYIVPQDILYTVGEHGVALCSHDYRRAQDYELVEIDDMEVLARKYQIRLRYLK